MALSTMYPAQPNSPQTSLAAGISAADTSMTVYDATVLPAAPNLCTIGGDENAEVVQYTTITGNVVSGLIRGASGTTASVWAEGAPVSRDFTSYDHDTFISNINDLESRKLDSVSWGSIGGTLSSQTDLNTALGLKADLASPIFTGTPATTTPSVGDNSTRIASTAFVQSELDEQILYFTNQTVSVGTSAQIMRIPSSGTNSTITTDTVVLSCVFTAPANINSNVSWQSYAGYVTFTGTCTSATTAAVILGKKGN